MGRNSSVIMGPISRHMYFWMTIVLIFAFWLEPTIPRPPLLEDCPIDCSCDNIFLIVNCSNADLTYIPSVRNNTREFILDGNQLKVIETKVFSQFKNLRSLSLANNFIDEIQENSFKSQRKLVKLDLSGNNFGEVPVALQHLRILKELDLRNNQIRTLSKEPWSNLTRLERLLLDNNSIPNIPMVMTSKLKGIVDLSISNNDISAIPSGQFMNTSNLETLDLSYNQITTKQLETSSSTFSYNYLPTAATEEEYLADDTAEGITVDSLKGLAKLKELNLAGNLIRQLENGIFSDLVHLEALNLNDNGLEHIQDLVFREQYQLHILSLSQNALLDLPQSLFEDLRQLKVLRLDDNHISDISPLTNVHMFHLQELSLNDNQIETIDPRGFEGYIAIEQIILHSNKLKHVPEVRNLSRLFNLDLSNNRIKEISPVNAFDGTALMFLNLSNNRLQILERSTFWHLENLRILRVDGNRYVCDCRIQWIVDYYQDYTWTSNFGYGRAEEIVICQAPPLVYDMALYDGVVYARGLSCTEYADPHRVVILVASWGGVVAFSLLVFWVYTYFDFKKRFYIRKPRKQYRLLRNADKNDSIPLTGDHSKVRFRSFDSETDSYVYDEETTV